MVGATNHSGKGEVITDVSQVMPWHMFEVYDARYAPRELGAVARPPQPIMTGVFTAKPQPLVLGREGLCGGDVMALYQEGHDSKVGRQRLGAIPLASLNILPEIDPDSVDTVPWLELAANRICILGPQVVPTGE